MKYLMFIAILFAACKSTKSVTVLPENKRAIQVSDKATWIPFYTSNSTFDTVYYFLDTVRAEFLVSDTTHWFSDALRHISHKEAGCTDSTAVNHAFYGHIVQDKIDRGRANNTVYSAPGYAVRRSGFIIQKLNLKKEPFKQSIIIWQTLFVNSQH